MDQCNLTKDEDINPKNYGHLIFNDEAKIILWKKKANDDSLTGYQLLEECKSIHSDHFSQNSSLSTYKTTT